MTRAEADRRVHELEADWATLALVDPVRNHRRETLLG
jgi:hypothetical protein